jgi:hypothetical protein
LTKAGETDFRAQTQGCKGRRRGLARESAQDGSAFYPGAHCTLESDLSSAEDLNALRARPIDWINETGEEEGATCALQYDWYHCLNENAVSRDDHVTDLECFYDEELDADELKNLIDNLRLRRDAAIRCHKDRGGRLAGLRFLRPANHGKHFKIRANKATFLKWSNRESRISTRTTAATSSSNILELVLHALPSCEIPRRV